MVIIAICGFQGVGKDIFANYLVNNYNFQKFSFATTIKDVLSDMFGWDRKLLEGDTIESRKFRETIDPWWASKLTIPDLTPRKMLQIVGTDLFRKYFHDKIWVHIIEKKIIDFLKINSSYRIIISDCRFPNEISMLKNLGAQIIHIERNLPEWFERYKNGDDFVKPLELHLSETAWIRENFDYTITNNTNDISEFELQIDSLVKDKFDIDIKANNKSQL